MQKFNEFAKWVLAQYGQGATANAILEKASFGIEPAESIASSVTSTITNTTSKLPPLSSPWADEAKGRVTNTASQERVRVDGSSFPSPKLSQFSFGRKSKTELAGVIPALVSVAELGLKLSTQDFMIYDGLRTKAEQSVLVAKGASKTMNSKHLPQADGFSHAIDAVPVVGTLPKWDWELIYHVALAIDQAATQLGVANRIVWGGAWDRRLSDFGGNSQAYRKVVEDYCARHPGKDFIDGPHFQWMEN